MTSGVLRVAPGPPTGVRLPIRLLRHAVPSPSPFQWPIRDAAAAHDELVASWQERIALLESVYQRLDPADEAVPGDLRRPDELAAQVSDIGESLGTPECGL